MIYRKQGSVVRWENGTLIRVIESGVAIEDGDYFECRPAVPSSSEFLGSSESLRSPSRGTPRDSEELRGTPQGLRGIARALNGLPIERLILLHGIAVHECEGRTWREETERIHAALVHDRLRALVDVTIGPPAAGRPVHRPLAGAGEPPADRPAGSRRAFDEIFTIAEAVRRAEPHERDAPNNLRLEPNVTAALLPHLVGRTPPNVRLVQTAGGVDGYGRDIVEADGDWPNAWRPSYRVRPVRIPLNLRLECDDTNVDDGAPRAIALLAPVRGLTLDVLVVDRERVYPATVTVDRIRAVATERIWYPYGGGSFGAAMML